MISQIIEARPEDLRLHLEEAAGISKYKERRKETESRIKSTRENLDRLNDVRQEVDKQLDHLNRQAKQAERYQKLKEEHARVDAELKALHLRSLQGELDARGQALRQIEQRSDQLTTEQRAIEARLEDERGKQIEATDHFNAVQGELYRVGGEIARVEQQINYNRDLAERLNRAAKETDTALNEVAEHIRGDRDQIELLRLSLAESEPQIETLQIEAEQRQDALRVAEAAIVDWQSRWDAYARDSGESARAAEVERTRLNFLDKQSLDASIASVSWRTSAARWMSPRSAMAPNALLMRQEETARKSRATDPAARRAQAASGDRVQDRRAKCSTSLNDARSRVQTARGRLSFAGSAAACGARPGEECRGRMVRIGRIGSATRRVWAKC